MDNVRTWVNCNPTSRARELGGGVGRKDQDSKAGAQEVKAQKHRLGKHEKKKCTKATPCVCVLSV